MINRRAQLLGIRNQHDFDVFNIKDMFDNFQHIDGVIGAAAVEFVDKQDNRFVCCQFFQAGFERFQIFFRFDLLFQQGFDGCINSVAGDCVSGIGYGFSNTPCLLVVIHYLLKLFCQIVCILLQDMTRYCLKYGFYSESSYFRNSISETFAFFRRLTISIFRRTGFNDFGKQCQQRLSAMVRAEGIDIDRLIIELLLLHEPN